MFNLYYTNPIPKQGLLDSLSLKHGRRSSSLLSMFIRKIETTVPHLFCFLQVPAGKKITTSKISNSDTETKGPIEPECSTTHVLAHSERNFQVHDIIAVAYEDDFYVSEVMNVVSKDELEISSMARYGTSF